MQIEINWLIDSMKTRIRNVVYLRSFLLIMFIIHIYYKIARNLNILYLPLHLMASGYTLLFANIRVQAVFYQNIRTLWTTFRPK